MASAFKISQLPPALKNRLHTGCILLLLFLSLPYPSLCQTPGDSKSDTTGYAWYLNKAGTAIRKGDYSLAIKPLLRAADILENTSDSGELSTVYLKIADTYSQIRANENAAEYYLKALEKNSFTDSDEKISTVEKYGDILSQLERYEDAVEQFSKAAAYFNREGIAAKEADLLIKKGIALRNIPDYERSLENDTELLRLSEKTGDKPLRFKILNDIGFDHTRLDNYDMAVSSFTEAYKAGIIAGVGEKELIHVQVNIAILYFNSRNTGNAINTLKKALETSSGHHFYAESGIIENLLSTIYLNSGDLYNAGVFSRQSIESAVLSGDKKLLQQCYNTYSQVLKAGNDPISALNYYEKYLNLRDSLLLEGRIKEEEQSRRKFDAEKTEKEIRLEIADENLFQMRVRQYELEQARQRQKIDSLEQAKQVTRLEFEKERQATILALEQQERKLSEEQNQRLRQDSIIQDQQIQLQEEREIARVADIKRLELEKKQEQIVKRRAISVALLLVLIALSILAGLFFLRKKNRLLAEQKREIQEKNRYLEQLNEEINTQKETIEEKNKAITDSIIYAERIQAAVLTPESFFRDNLDDYFVFFRPRDIVSGDFYWGARKEDMIVVVAADCTGHGVPGAFMSMFGVAFLNEIVNDMEKPRSDEILNRLRKNVIEALRQKGEEGEAKDGMDIALCIVDYENMNLQFSGAFNPLYYIRDNELLQIKGDRMPIGIHLKEYNDFAVHEMEMKKGDCFYIFSDGYMDQFGGPEGKKFKFKPFQDLILANHHRTMEEQKEILADAFDDWKQHVDQIDDVLVIGVRV